ncbi:hypothetical protein [Ornithinimicrobium sp. CNJ-824]|uniref:hypothetical protein n=1 Tax=Ornithinimicrobium sp. CNJ-824 TaxID=1904966 RepID=UPI00117F83F9|nr:hypothetical protein [Ornithinimicrobium sp. CNJ-824]
MVVPQRGSPAVSSGGRLELLDDRGSSVTVQQGHCLTADQHPGPRGWREVDGPPHVVPDVEPLVTLGRPGPEGVDGTAEEGPGGTQRPRPELAALRIEEDLVSRVHDRPVSGQVDQRGSLDVFSLVARHLSIPDVESSEEDGTQDDQRAAHRAAGEGDDDTDSAGE